MAPQRIIFYRDGVGNAQFDIVRRREIAAIRRAFANFGGPEYRPQLVFLVVQKRTHFRLFQPDPAGGYTLGNALPGTVIDSQITANGQAPHRTPARDTTPHHPSRPCERTRPRL